MCENIWRKDKFLNGYRKQAEFVRIQCQVEDGSYKAGPRLNIDLTFGTEKLPDGENVWELVSTQYTNVTDRQTDGRSRTPHDGIQPHYA